MILNVLMRTVLILVAAGLIIGVIIIPIMKSTEPKQEEERCRFYNVIAAGGNINEGGATVDWAPDACKTMTRVVPQDEKGARFAQTKKGAMRNVAQLAEKCFKLFLEGKSPDLFGSDFGEYVRPCFICYAFTVEKDTNYFTPSELLQTLNDPVTAVDKSDRCNAIGGGYCQQGPVCDDKFPRRVTGKRGVCKPDEVCCMPSSRNDKCEARGGTCVDKETVAPVSYKSFPEWQCPLGSECFIKEEQVVSFSDYFRNKASSVYVATDMAFYPQGYECKPEDPHCSAQQIYAVTYVSETKKPLEQALGVNVATHADRKITSLPEGNLVLIDKYEQIEKYCAVKARA